MYVVKTSDIRCRTSDRAGVAKLADALASGASGSNTMGVQISLPAPPHLSRRELFENTQ